MGMSIAGPDRGIITNGERHALGRHSFHLFQQLLLLKIEISKYLMPIQQRPILVPLQNRIDREMMRFATLSTSYGHSLMRR
jgi:hypothetical protein